MQQVFDSDDRFINDSWMLNNIDWDNLDHACINEIEATWAAESEERIDAVDRGELQTTDGSLALRELRSALNK